MFKALVIIATLASVAQLSRADVSACRAAVYEWGDDNLGCGFSRQSCRNHESEKLCGKISMSCSERMADKHALKVFDLCSASAEGQALMVDPHYTSPFYLVLMETRVQNRDGQVPSWFAKVVEKIKNQ